tara:strand:- start:1235 stop:1594 length:360 start_codon:yes stop_codon:yes gene_type:complete
MKKVIETLAISTLLILIIGIITTDLLTGIKLSLAYLFLFYLPVIFFISLMKLDLLERIVLTNLAGLTYGSIYYILDVTLKIPITKILFGALAIILTILGFLIYKKRFTTLLKEPTTPNQ